MIRSTAPLPGRCRTVTSVVVSGFAAAAMVAVVATMATTTTNASVGAAPSTAAATTTDAAVTTTSGLFTVSSDVVETPTGYIADGYTPTSAFDDLQSATQDPLVWLQIWATPGATRTSGRWIAIETSPYGSSVESPNETEVERVLVGGHYALVRTQPDGIRVLSSGSDSQHSVDIASFGFTDDEVGTFLDAVRPREGGGAPSLGAAAPILDGLDLVVSRASQSGIADNPMAATEHYTNYRQADAPAGFYIQSGRQSASDLSAVLLVTAGPVDPVAATVAPDRTIMIGDHHAVVGSIGPDPYSFDFVEWHDGPNTVTVSGDTGFPLDRLLLIAASVRPAGPDEWQAAKSTRQQQSTTSYVEPPSPDGYTTIGEVRSASQTDWNIGLAVVAAAKPPAPGVIWAQIMSTEPTADGGSDSSAPTTGNMFTLPTGNGAPALSKYLFVDATVLIATVDSATVDSTTGAATAVALRVTLANLEPAVIPLVPIEGSTVSGAAYAFSQVGEYSAELIDADGDAVTFLTQ